VRASDELELELIQTQMAQKPMLRAEVYAHAMRASQNRKKGSKSSYVLTSESGGRATHTVQRRRRHNKEEYCNGNRRRIKRGNKLGFLIYTKGPYRAMLASDFRLSILHLDRDFRAISYTCRGQSKLRGQLEPGLKDHKGCFISDIRSEM